MEKVIGLLFDIEKKANQILERANDEKTELFEENEKAIAQLEIDIADENNQKINELVLQAEKELDKEKQLLMEDSNKQLTDLEINYKKNHDNMVTKVFHSITKLG